MSWTRIDDQLHGHHKIKRAWKCRPALGLHLMALSYSACYDLKGRVPVEFVEEKLPNARERNVAVTTLLEVGMWEHHENGHDWLIHDWHEYNGSAKTREEIRATKSAAGKKGAAARWGDSSDMAACHSSAIPPANDTAMAPSPSPSQQKKSPTDSVVSDLFDYWREQTGHTASRPTRDRLAKVKARLNEGFTPEQIRAAIDGAAAQPFVNEAGKVFDDLELICRSGSKLEGFIDRATHTPQRPASQIRALPSGYTQKELDRMALQAERRAAGERLLSKLNDEGQAA